MSAASDPRRPAPPRSTLDWTLRLGELSSSSGPSRCWCRNQTNDEWSRFISIIPLRYAQRIRACASGSGEDRAPVLESEIGSDDWAGVFVPRPAAAVEQVARTRVAREISQLVQNQDVGSGVPLHAPLDRRKRLLLEQVGERRVHGREADGPSRLECALAEVLSEGTLADTARSAKKDVVPARREIERKKLLVAWAVDGAGKAPVEAIEGLHRAERGALGA